MADINLDELMKQKEDADQQKGLLNLAGTIGQNMTSAPSFAELYTGRKGYHPDVKSVTDAAAATIEDPVAKQLKTYELYKTAKENDALKRQEADIAQRQDPNSSYSLAAKAAYKKFTGQDPEPGMSGFDVDKFMDMKKMNETEAKSRVDFGNDLKKMRAEQEFRTGERKKAEQHDLDKITYENNLKNAKKNDPQQRLRDLNAADKARYDNALMVLKGIDDMGSALDKGDNTFSMIGDNKYTEAQRRATEAFGRMQSGGAINKDEEARFGKMLPGAMDRKEMQRQKLIDQRNEMISRLKTLGFTPEEVGYSPKEFAYGKAGKGQKSLNLVDTANADGGASRSLSDRDRQAIKWAVSNPNDPRSKAILEKNGL